MKELFEEVDPRQLPTTTELLYVHAAAELGSFTDAANRFGVTPATVSKAVGKIESKLGDVAFFSRLKGARIEPLANASDLVRQTQRVLEELEELHAIANEFRALGLDKTLTIGCYPVHLARYAALFGDGLGETTVRFRQTARQLENGEHQGVRLIRNGVVDVAIGPQRAFQGLEAHVEFQRLYKWECVAYAPAYVEFAEQGRISPTELAGLPLLVTPRVHSSRRALERAMHRVGRGPFRVFVESSDVISLITLAEAGAGIAVIPSDSAEIYGLDADDVLRVEGTANANYIGWSQRLSKKNPERLRLVKGLVRSLTDFEKKR